MAFPATPLDVEVSLALSADLTDPTSWSWTDITDYVRESKRIRIKRGRSSERSTIPPSRCTMTVDNADGRFCRFLPTGTWYGQIGPNTPLRVRVNNGSGYVTRFIGYVSGWPPSWDPSESDQTVQLVADGVLRRLGQGRVLRSALFRTLTADGGFTPYAYWTLEDGTDVTSFAAETTGTAAANDALYVGSTDLVEPAGCTSIPGSGPCAQLPAGALINFVPKPYSSTGVWAVQVAVHLDNVNSQLAVVVRDTVAATSLTTFVYATTPLFRCTGVTIGTGSTIFTADDTIGASEVVGLPMSLIVGGSSAAGGTIVARLIDGYGNTIASTTSTATGITMIPRSVSTQCVPFGGNGSVGVGHMVVYNDATFDISTDGVDTAQAAGGWSGEMAHERVDRLCTEESIPVTVTATTSQAMGPQGSNNIVTLLRECATADFGLLYEPTDSAGLAFLSSSERYNQATAITLQYDQGHLAPPWEPTDDDRDTRNDVTASRRNGASVRVTDDASIASVGVYDDSISANVQVDGQLGGVAGWAVNLGVVDELRWPAVKPNFLDHPTLIDDWMAADLGSQLHVTGHPSPLAPDEIKQIIEGYDETLGSYEYTVVANLSPASGWTVAELDDDDLGKLDTAGCVMQAAATSGATSFTVATTVLPRWTTDAGEMPIPILVSGQVNSVTAVANVSPSFVAAGTVAHASNASVTPTMPAGVQAGDLLLVLAAIRNSGTGTVDTPSGYTVLLTSGNMTLLGKVHTGTESAPTVTFAGGVANADTSAQMAAFRGTGITVHASTAQLNGSAQNIAWPVLDMTRDNCVVLYLGWKQDDWTSVASPGTEIGEPDTTTGDDQGIVWAYAIQTTATLVATGSFTVTGGASAISRGAVVALATDVQTMTVTRGTNGVTKAIPIGSQVNVYRPARLAL